MRLRAFIILATVILFAFSLPSRAAQAIDDVRSAQGLIAADRAFAAASASTDGLQGLMAQFADDVIMPVPGKGFGRGKAAVREAFRARPGSDRARIEWTPVGVGISADADQGYTFGFMSERKQDGEETALKYLSYWRRDADGWRVIAYKHVGRAEGPIDLAARPPLLPAANTLRSAAGGDPARSLANAERAFSDAAQSIGLTAAFTRFGTPDSINLGGANNAGFVFGAKAIGRLVGEGESEHGSRLNWASDERVVVAGSGDLGLSVGNIRFNQRAEDGSERAPIAFFTVWRRAAMDQPWRYVAE